MSKDIVKDSIKCLANMEIKETTYQVARDIVLDEIERLNNIIKEVREYIEENVDDKLDDFTKIEIGYGVLEILDKVGDKE